VGAEPPKAALASFRGVGSARYLQHYGTKCHQKAPLLLANAVVLAEREDRWELPSLARKRPVARSPQAHQVFRGDDGESPAQEKQDRKASLEHAPPDERGLLLLDSCQLVELSQAFVEASDDRADGALIERFELAGVEGPKLRLYGRERTTKLGVIGREESLSTKRLLQ
jgi:hypothetical protein